jgi:membrane associated rhomboid family serine protease
MNLFDEIGQSFRRGSALTRLIYINIAVFVAVGLGFVIFRLATPRVSLSALQDLYNLRVMKYLMVPSLLPELLHRPWTVVTYMFTHFNFLHLLFNILTLYWFGQIFLRYLSGRQLVSTYLIGGIAGAVCYMLLLNLVPGLQEGLGSSMLGASASIMAVVVAITFLAPDFTMNLMFIGEVKLKYITMAFLVLDVLMIASYNAGGHIAHLGGALWGYWFYVRYRKGKDAGKWLNQFLESAAGLFRPRPKLNVTYRKNARYIKDEEYNRNKKTEQKEIDRILDKIAKGGYDSLTREEKETLFQASDRNRN